jgi:hypothetical protein
MVCFDTRQSGRRRRMVPKCGNRKRRTVKMLLFGCSQSLGLCPCSSRSRILKSNPARCFHSEIQRYAPKKVLERNSYEVISVTTIGEAVRALHQFPICATVADHLLERATGAQLARDMKNQARDSYHLIFGRYSGKLRRCRRLSQQGRTHSQVSRDSTRGGRTFPFIVITTAISAKGSLVRYRSQG